MAPTAPPPAKATKEVVIYNNLARPSTSNDWHCDVRYLPRTTPPSYALFLYCVPVQGVFSERLERLEMSTPGALAKLIVHGIVGHFSRSSLRNAPYTLKCNDVTLAQEISRVFHMSKVSPDRCNVGVTAKSERTTTIKAQAAKHFDQKGGPGGGQAPDELVVCEACLTAKTRTEMMKCGWCKTVCYCDRDCQGSMWISKHRAICSELAREEGNTAFRSADWAAAIEHYTEAIRRDPTDAKGYNNRSAAYHRMDDNKRALKDVEEALRIDPKYIKGYMRKSHVLFSMGTYDKAREMAEMAKKYDKTNSISAEIERQIKKCNDMKRR